MLHELINPAAYRMQQELVRSPIRLKICRLRRTMIQKTL